MKRSIIALAVFALVGTYSAETAMAAKSATEVVSNDNKDKKKKKDKKDSNSATEAKAAAGCAPGAAKAEGKSCCAKKGAEASAKTEEKATK